MSEREIVVVWYYDHVEFEMNARPIPSVPALCMKVGILDEETDEYIRVIDREEELWGEDNPRAHGMVFPKGAVVQMVKTGVEAIQEDEY